MQARRTLILSPHLDDAAFSLGGAMCDGRFGAVTVASVFTRSRYRISGYGDPDSVTALRRDEDLNALKSLGAEAIHLGLDDASLRQVYADETAYMSLEADPTLDPIWPDTVERVADLLRSQNFHRIIVPLGVGGHIDHRLTRNAALLSSKFMDIVWFYKDATYLRSEATIRELTQDVNAKRERTLRSSKGMAKRNLAQFYASQINDDILNCLETDLATFGGERIWIAQT